MTHDCNLLYCVNKKKPPAMKHRILDGTKHMKPGASKGIRGTEGIFPALGRPKTIKLEGPSPNLLNQKLWDIKNRLLATEIILLKGPDSKK